MKESTKTHTLHSGKKTQYRQNKVPLVDSRRYYVKNVRIKTLIDFIDSFCITRHESKLDVFYFLLMDELDAQGDHIKAEAVRQLADNVVACPFSADESLAMRIDLLQSKSIYRKQYELLKSKGDNILATPSSVDSAELKFMPLSCTYQVMDQEPRESFTYEGRQLFCLFNRLF